MSKQDLDFIEKTASQLFDAEQEEAEARKYRDSLKDGATKEDRKSAVIAATITYAKAQNLRVKLHDAIHGRTEPS
jgi:hypothetical protein